MRIVLASMGTLGDVKLYITLGRALQAAGHDVVLAASPGFRSLVEASGLSWRSFGLDFRDVMARQAVKAWSRRGIRMQLATLIANTHLGEIIESGLREAPAIARGADLLIAHPLLFNAPDIARAYDIPWVLLPPAPITPSAKYPMFFFPRRSLGSVLNRFTYNLVRLQGVPFASQINAVRAELGLEPTSAWQLFRRHGQLAPAAVLYPFSEHIVPRAPDWPGYVHPTGFWFSDEDERPLESRTEEFLAAGPAPIFIGFGSMTALHRRDYEMAVAAARQLGLRVVLATGWSDEGVPEFDRDVHVIDYAPYQKLFPRMRAVIHHGGLGTTGQGLRAGRPTLICPVTADQPFWGYRVADAGCGPQPLSLAAWTPARLRRRICELLEPHYTRRAAEIGRLLASEDAMARAVAVVEESVANGRTRTPADRQRRPHSEAA